MELLRLVLVALKRWWSLRPDRLTRPAEEPRGVGWRGFVQDVGPVATCVVYLHTLRVEGRREGGQSSASLPAAVQMLLLRS